MANSLLGTVEHPSASSHANPSAHDLAAQEEDEGTEAENGVSRPRRTGLGAPVDARGSSSGSNNGAAGNGSAGGAARGGASGLSGVVSGGSILAKRKR